MFFNEVLTKPTSRSEFIGYLKLCEPLVHDILKAKTEDQVDMIFPYFVNLVNVVVVCQNKSHLIPSLGIKIMKILHGLKEESLFYHMLNFSPGPPTIWLFFFGK